MSLPDLAGSHHIHTWLDTGATKRRTSLGDLLIESGAAEVTLRIIVDPDVRARHRSDSHVAPMPDCVRTTDDGFPQRR